MIKYAFSLVMRRKLRTILTSLGITISVVLVSLIIFGMQDLQRLIQNSFQSQFKPNELYITNSSAIGAIAPTEGEGTNDEQEPEALTLITPTVVEELKQKEEVESITPMTVITSLEGTIDGFEKPLQPTFVSGWNVSGDDSYFVKFWGDSNPPKGEEAFISTQFVDYYGEKSEELIGKKIVLKTAQASSFGTIKTKETLDKSYEFTIKGVFDPGTDRNDVVISLDRSVEILGELGGFDSTQEFLDKVGYDMMRVQADIDQVDEVKTYIEEEYNFGSIFSSDDLLGFLNQIIGAFTLVLVLFGTVASVVAAIGIMNTMVMSIYEQTKEIGIIKAMGASSLQIMIVFLIQSGIIGLLGGLVGLGIVFTAMRVSDPFIVDILVENGFEVDSFFSFDLRVTLIIMAISMVVGIIAGLYPALKAGSLDPVKALRSE